MSGGLLSVQPQAGGMLTVPQEGLFSLGQPQGLVRPGNIDLSKRPKVRNADGSISTVRSMSVNFGNGEVLIPTVSQSGQLMTNDQAIQEYLKTGQHLGIFASPELATDYAKKLHLQQEQMYK